MEKVKMTINKHNKKRNIGIVYELLLNHIATSLIEGNKSQAKKATKIIEKNFKKGTELYKEFRLFNALANSTITNTHTVASILNEAKIAAKKLDHDKLKKEKSSLLREINYTIGKDFFYKNISNYRELGLVQMTLNEWRKEDKDIKKLVDFETRLGELLLKEKSNLFVENKNINASHSDKLVLKILNEKFNKKYGEELNKDQKTIIENYVFLSSKKKTDLNNFFLQKKKESLAILERFEDMSENKYLLSKVDSVKNKINELSHTDVNDSSIIKFLTLTKMINEIEKEL
jgi:hypothetical protein